MKKLILIAFLTSIAFCRVQAQTANELMGKWQLVKWTKNGKDKKVTDSTYQVFNDKNQFISIMDGKEHKGKWKLSKDNKTLNIRSGLILVKFRIDQFDSKRRVITADELGTLEYQKVN